MQQGGFFPELKTQKSEKKIETERTFPEMNLQNLLSDKFIDDNGMFGLRMLLKRARKTQKWDKYQQVLNAEIAVKKGENTIKNNLRHLVLYDLICK